jgi:hypothetical protein
MIGYDKPNSSPAMSVTTATRTSATTATVTTFLTSIIASFLLTVAIATCHLITESLKSQPGSRLLPQYILRTRLIGIEAAAAIPSACATASCTSYIVCRGSWSLLGSIALAGSTCSLVDGFGGWFGLTIRILVGGIAYW